MQGLYDRGDIYQGTYEGWYCPRCADFKTEQEIVDGNKCPIHKIELTGRRRTTTSSGCPPSRSGSSSCTPSGRTS